MNLSDRIGYVSHTRHSLSQTERLQPLACQTRTVVHWCKRRTAATPRAFNIQLARNQKEIFA